MYDKLSQDLGGFREKIAPGAFDSAVAEDDIRALFNHDPNLVLGRSAPAKGVSTAEITSDERGLLVDVPELPATSYARDLHALLERGDVDQSSFGFRVVSESWDYADPSDPNSEVIRTLNEVRLFDVSIVTFPAYLDTVAEARSIAAALAEIREGKVLSGKNRDTIAGVVDALSALLDEADGTTDNLYNFNSIRAAVEQFSTRASSSDDEANEEADLAVDMMILLGRAFLATDPEDDDTQAMNEILSALEKIDAEEDDEAAEGGARSHGSDDLGFAKARLRLLELSAPDPTLSLR